MKREIARKIIVLFVLLTLIFSVIETAPAQAAGLYTHTVFIEHSIEQFKKIDTSDLSNDYSDIVAILENHGGIVNYGSLFPDVASQANGTWGEMVHDTAFLQGCNVGIPIFRNALTTRILPNFKHNPRTAEDEKLIAFLFGLIGHQEADGPWHFCEAPLESRLNFGVTEVDVDFVFYRYDQNNNVEFGYLQNIKPVIGQASNDINSPMPSDSCFLGICIYPLNNGQAAVELLWGTATTDVGFDQDEAKTWLENYEHGGIADGAGHTANAWVTTWKAMKTYSPITKSTSLPALPDGNNGWYRQPVNVTLNATGTFLGKDTGPFTTWYSINDGQFQEYVEPITVSEEGIHRISYYSVDSMGISEQVNKLDVKIDMTPPSVNVWTDQPQYTRVEPFIAHFTGSDAISGLASITGEFNGQPVTDGQEIDLLWLPLGTYTISARAEDMAGYVTEGSQNIELIATLDGLKETVARLCAEGYITKSGTCKELTAKLNAALAANSRKNHNAAMNIINAFQNAVEAQTGKSIHQLAADLLILDSTYVKENLYH